jgi:hypothetical protein
VAKEQYVYSIIKMQMITEGDYDARLGTKPTEDVVDVCGEGDSNQNG